MAKRRASGTPDVSKLCGWVQDEAAVHKLRVDLGRYGTVYGSNPALKGYWEDCKARGITAILLFREETKAFGKPMPPNSQRAGTCVSMGTDRAIQLALSFDFIHRGLATVPVDICFEPIYAGCRVIIGKGSIRGDGAVGAWAAEWVEQYGVVRRGEYGPWDLTKPNESLAVANADKGDRIPKEIIEAGKQHPVRTLHVKNDYDEVADCIASGKGIARCHSQLYGSRDANGMSKPSKAGNHCECLGGIFVMPNGKDGVLEHQSWGENNPSGPKALKVKPGYGAEDGVIEIPSNCYGITMDEYIRAMKARSSSDAWAFQVGPESVFAPESLREWIATR